MGTNLVKGIQSYEFFGGITPKNHAFFKTSFSILAFKANGIHFTEKLEETIIININFHFI